MAKPKIEVFQKPGITFGNLIVGDYFEECGKLYIKIIYQDDCNCIRLETGDRVTLERDCPVKLAEVEIKAWVRA